MVALTTIAIFQQPHPEWLPKYRLERSIPPLRCSHEPGILPISTLQQLSISCRCRFSHWEAARRTAKAGLDLLRLPAELQSPPPRTPERLHGGNGKLPGHWWPSTRPPHPSYAFEVPRRDPDPDKIIDIPRSYRDQETPPPNSHHLETKTTL